MAAQSATARAKAVYQHAVDQSQGHIGNVHDGIEHADLRWLKPLPRQEIRD